ncbi:hypothetical protein H4R27_005031 [Coemansia aciculifera]|nr:hypothetical protein H4R27_005031 [Coemansia aciculifera]
MYDGHSTMDDIIQTVKLEVALDCEQGSTLSKVWSYVELAQRRLLQRNGMDSESVTVDDALKRYLWPFILKLPGMTFINDGTVIYEAASGSAAQSDVAKNFLALSASEAESRFPDLIMRASCKAINKEIFGREEGNEKLLRSANSYKLIQEISRSREKGVTQVQLSKIFGLDPRSTFHFIKNIDGEGLLAKSVTYDSGNTTNLWVLRRFASDRQGAMDKTSARGGGNSMEPAPIPNEDSATLTAYFVSNDLRKRASDILEAAGSRYMPETDLMDALKLDIWSKRHRKYFHRVLRDLSEQGVAEKVQLQLPDADLSGFQPEMYRPVAELMDVDESGDNAEPATNALGGDDEPDVGEANAEGPETEAPESTGSNKAKGGTKKTKGKAKKPAKIKRTREENQANRVKRERISRGLAVGHSYRRCVRFIKPYVEKGSVRTRLGIPLEQSTRAASNTFDDGDSDAVMADPDDADIEGGDDSSSDDDDELDVETMKDKDDILYVMKNHSVQVGALATLPPEAQVFRLIALSGSHGIVSRAIQFLLKWVSLKHLARCLIHLEQTPVFLPDGSWPGVYTSEKCKRENREHMDERLVISVEEFMGREHRKRFFVNPLAKMAIASLTAHSNRAVAQPSTSLSQPALPTQSPAASDSTALVTAVASDNRDDSSVPSSREPAMPTEQPETQSPAPVAAALTPEAELVLADMAKFNSFSDIYAEAKERSVPVNTIIRECVILGMLRQESVFACNTEQVVRCDQLVKSYVMANRDSPVMTPTLSKSLLKFSMDKRTFQRIVSSLADQNRLWTQDVYSLPDAARPSATTKVQIAIARDTDPAGPVVHTFIAQIRDLRKLNKQNPITVARRITDIVPVVRTEGAEERDRDFLLRKMDTDESRARGVKNFSLKHPLGRKYVDSNSAKRPRDSQGYAIVKRAKVSLVENTAKDRPLEDWDLVYKRLQHIPRRIGRAKNLYDYLANNLADNVDDTYVYENCAFRSSFLFYRLPLELLLQITGGIAYFQDLLPFIRYGICTRVDARTRESVEAQLVEAQSSEASSLESINLRLATPINMLPPIVSEIIESKVVRARLHIQSLIYALYILQLLRPVDTARDIVSMPPPPDAKDAFSSVPVASPKILGFGYQLIGKARILNKKGYDLALDAYNSMAKHRLDLTTCYLDTKVYDMTNKDGAFSYWSNLHMSAMTEAKHLQSTHILFGIGLPYYWILDVSLDGRQTKVLQSYVDEKQFLTPLDDPNLLADAAKRAGTTLEEARRYFQHQHSEMAKKSSKCKAYHVSRERYVKKRVERAKAIEVERRKQAEANGDANGRTSGEASGDVGSSGKKQRMRWTENDSTRVMVWYAVMRHHANMHGHMFVLLNIGELFPNRGLNMDPSDSARHHWQRIQHNPKLKLKSDKIHCVWKYVFRDAVERGDLDDSEDLNSFDAKTAVYYYCSKIQNESLDGLVSRYADDLDEDSVVFEPIGSSVKPAQSKPAAGKPKPTVVDNEPPEYEESEASEVSEAGGNLIFRLPATLQGKESRYKIKPSSRTRAAGTKGFEFTEDTLRENLSVKTREQNGSGVMLTTHSGWECATDHIYPSTIVLPIRPNGVASNSMEVDGETPTPAAAVAVKGESIVVTRGSSYVPYRDTMGRRRHVKRKFDASELVSRISELALGGDIDPEGDRVPRAELGKLDRSKLYAELASLQAMIVNLAITPNDEYDVVTGHRLLGSKRNVANDAYQLAKSNSTLTRLSNMSASAGLSLQPTATAPVASAESAEAPPGSAEPAAGALTSLTNALKSTTVAYETTGMTRITTKPGTTRSVANRSDANDADDSTNEDADAGDEPAIIDTLNRSDRKVPGRGHAVSDKFMGAIKPTHADRFASLRGFFGAADSMLDGHLGHAAFERLCWLVGQGKLWLRPEYGSDMHESLLSGMVGVKNQQDNAVAADFIVKAVYVDHMAGMEVDGSQMDDVYRRSTSKSVYTALLPTGDSLAVVSRVLIGIIHEMGAMGASEYELFAILVVLFGSSAYKTTLAALPNDVCSVLSTRSQLSALLHLLALEGKVHTVGSNDIRYVSNDAYRKYWSLTLEGIERRFEPYLGQNMSGSVNTTFTLGMLTSLVSHIVDNPGIPQFMLVRRFFAPVIPKKEVLSYLGQLIDMGLVVTENIKSDVLMVKDQAWSVASSTHYFMAPDYRHRIAQLPFTWVASHLNKA